MELLNFNVTNHCMKSLLTLTVLILITLGCSTKQTPRDGKLIVEESKEKAAKVFKQVADFPTIKDTAQFIADLRQIVDFEIHESPVQKEQQAITALKKVKLYGSDNDFIFIEYDWKVGSMAEFPWKQQLLFTTEGKLIKALTGQRYDFVKAFPNQHPFLLTVVATARGNGGHEMYKVSGDTLENVYEGYFDCHTQTYDGYEDLSVFEPNELNISFRDENKDGVNDIVFTGQKLMLGKYTKDSLWYDVENNKSFSVENPAASVPIKYIFLYDKQTGHFTAKEKYRLDN